MTIRHIALTRTIATIRLLHFEWAEKMLAFNNGKAPVFMHNDQNQTDSPAEGEITLDMLKKGQSAVVKRLITEDSKNLQKLLAMGILPGRIVRVLQRYPVFILEIDRTQAAMDKDLARKIVLKSGKRGK
ncbi:MAG: FeoA family protein [Bacteroidales bacterium]|nr:ferrous iron transport protein A [Bacteroidales bacterium]MBS3776392.1 ferrous iron transport protein A [Bacteroidales bacterium]